MDTMKFLLGATVALLLGAIVVSWKGMQDGVANASPEEIAQMKLQIQELQDALKDVNGAPANPQPKAPEIDAAIQARLAEQQRKIELLESQQKVDLEAQLKVDEEGLLAQKALENKDSELRRARQISDALLMGKVKEYISDPNFGSFIIFEAVMPKQIQVGTVLGIRRNTGILAQYKVSEITPEGVIANPLPGFGPVTPNIGDELIFPPQF